MTINLLATALVACAAAAAQEETYAPDKDGYIRNWLVLGPFPNEYDSDGAHEIKLSQIPDEALLAPRAGEKVTIRGKSRAWKAYASPRYHVDFNEWLKNPANVRAQNCFGYLVTYVHSDRERKDLRCRMVSNDQARLYLNGRTLLTFRQTRRVDRNAEDTAKNVTLRKGRNVVVFKIINESNDWGGGIRFTDAKGRPLTDIRVTTPAKP